MTNISVRKYNEAEDVPVFVLEDFLFLKAMFQYLKLACSFK